MNVGQVLMPHGSAEQGVKVSKASLLLHMDDWNLEGDEQWWVLTVVEYVVTHHAECKQPSQSDTIRELLLGHSIMCELLKAGQPGP